MWCTSIVARVNHWNYLTIDHASPSRRSTVPTTLLIEKPKTNNFFGRARYAFSVYCIEISTSYPIPVPFSRLRPTSILPLTAIAFPLLSSLPDSSLSHTSDFLVSSSNASRSALYISRSSHSRGCSCWAKRLQPVELLRRGTRRALR